MTTTTPPLPSSPIGLPIDVSSHTLSLDTLRHFDAMINNAEVMKDASSIACWIHLVAKIELWRREHLANRPASMPGDDWLDKAEPALQQPFTPHLYPFDWPDDQIGNALFRVAGMYREGADRSENLFLIKLQQVLIVVARDRLSNRKV